MSVVYVFVLFFYPIILIYVVERELNSSNQRGHAPSSCAIEPGVVRRGLLILRPPPSMHCLRFTSIRDLSVRILAPHRLSPGQSYRKTKDVENGQIEPNFTPTYGMI